MEEEEEEEKKKKSVFFRTCRCMHACSQDRVFCWCKDDAMNAIARIQLLRGEPCIHFCLSKNSVHTDEKKKKRSIGYPKQVAEEEEKRRVYIGFFCCIPNTQQKCTTITTLL